MKCKEIEKAADVAGRAAHPAAMTAPATLRVLLVDDDIELTAMLGEYLTGEGFAVTGIHNGQDAVPAAVSGAYDAVVLDVMLPRLSGVEALRAIRQRSMIPVLMLTAKGDSVDRVVGLELGADDYVAKPYFPRELVARLRAILRRRAVESNSTELRLGDLLLDRAARQARCGTRTLELTASEFDLLGALMRAAGSVVTKDELSMQVLGRARESYDRSIDVHVSNLRHKLAAAGSQIVIETVRGIGYRLRDA